MRVHWEIVPVQRTAIFEKVPGHPMIFARGGEIFDEFAPITPMELCAAFTGGADKDNREARIVGHRHKNSFSITRVALEPNAFCVRGFVGFEVVESAACTPGPGAQSTPIIGFSRLAFVAQANDAFVEFSAVVRLNAGGIKHGVAPAFGEHLLLPCGTGICEAGESTRGKPI